MTARVYGTQNPTANFHLRGIVISNLDSTTLDSSAYQTSRSSVLQVSGFRVTRHWLRAVHLTREHSIFLKARPPACANCYRTVQPSLMPPISVPWHRSAIIPTVQVGFLKVNVHSFR